MTLTHSRYLCYCEDMKKVPLVTVPIVIKHSYDIINVLYHYYIPELVVPPVYAE